MFEEVPPRRRGIAGVTARRVVLGPFVVGGGVLLAAIGGSVAIAATVITASTIRLSDVPPPSHLTARATAAVTTIPVATTPAAAAVRTAPAGIAPESSHRTALAGAQPLTAPATDPSRPQSSSLGVTPSATGAPPTESRRRPVRAPAATTDPRSSAVLASATPSTTSASASPVLPPPVTRPEGNALVYVSGYHAATRRIRYEFADVSTASDGSTRYRVSSPQRFSARIAAAVVVISGGTICPPADSRCTPAQLIAASVRGFFAEVAIDSSGQLQAVIERDSTATPVAPQRSGAPPSPSAPALVGSPPSASPAPSTSPAASASSAPSASPVPSASPSASGRG